jgi:hypothetical protein
MDGDTHFSFPVFSAKIQIPIRAGNFVKKAELNVKSLSFSKTSRLILLRVAVLF